MLAGLMAVSVAAAPAVAQDAPVTTAEGEDAAADENEDRIVITGSRIRRDSFTSTSPLQVVDSQTIAESGLIDVGEILRRTSVVQGVQLDQQFNSLFVSDAGPGGQAVGLRGLGPERTLALINGRRMAPAGVEGAPSFPDISLIPSSMIERVDILLDGASSVYGSDAVGGVINFILRDDFEGLDIEGQISQPEESGGRRTQLNGVLGVRGDRGGFTFAVEYTEQEELRGDDRDWMCYPAAGRDENDGYEFRRGETICGTLIDVVQSSDGRIDRFSGTEALPGEFLPLLGTFLVTRPGTDNPANLFGVEIPNYEIWDFSGAGLFGLHVNQDQDRHILPYNQRINAYFSADYDLDEFIPNAEAFFEFGVSNRQNLFVARRGTLGAIVTDENPFIPQSFRDALAAFNAANGGTNFTFADFGNIDVRPQEPWPDTNFVELTQYRGTFGLTGDLGFLGDFGAFRADEWDYEIFAGYTRSQGFSERTILREEAIMRATDVIVDDLGNPACRTVDDLTAPFNSGISREPCVPLNPFDLNLFRADGSKPSAEDQPGLVDYLRGFRTSTTFVDERIIGGFVTGPVFELPAGDLSAVLGIEWRETSIDTRSDDTTFRGLADGFFVDRRTAGDVELFEVYGELGVPILEGAPLAEVLEVNLSGRYVDHEFYGSNSVYSANARWEPTDWLTFRGTYGTSFRAPNLRELFLEGQSFFAAVNDPCEVPATAQDDLDGQPGFDTYNGGDDLDGDGVGDRDGRSLEVINNCITEGLDPFSLALGINTGNVETFSAGNVDLDPEESTAWTIGFVVEEPFLDWVDIRFGLNFFEYSIENSVFEPSAQFLVDQCYTSEDFPNDAFCTRRLRDPNTGFLLEIDATPFNIAEELSSGYDVNFAIEKDFDFMGRSFAATSDWVATFTDEVSDTIILPGAEPDYDDDAGEVGNPYWRFNANQRVTSGDWTVFWQVRYISEQGSREIDPVDNGLVGVPANCDGAGADAIFLPECFKIRPVFYHDLSLTYEGDAFTARVGVNNLFDIDPPVLDEDVSYRNDPVGVPVGVGYDLYGRTFFLNLSKSF